MINDNPLVSVIMPAYNAEKFIDRAITSILNQSYQNIELLVLNDCSTDKTKNIIEKYVKEDTRIKYFENEENLGYVKSFNKLIDLCNGDFMTSQDADDFSHIDRIQTQILVFENDLELQVCGTNYFEITLKGKIIRKTNFPENHDLLKKCEPPLAPFCTSTFMLKKEVYKVSGKYHDFFHRKGGEDVYWAYSLIDNYRTINTKENLYYYTQNPAGVTLDFKKLEPSNIGVIVTFLINQRRTKGADFLQLGQFDKLEEMLLKLREPYLKDKLLYAKEQMFRNLYVANKFAAIKVFFYIFLRNPFQSIKFYKRVLIYLIKIDKSK